MTREWKKTRHAAEHKGAPVETWVLQSEAEAALAAAEAETAAMREALEKIDQPWFPTREVIEEIRAIARTAAALAPRATPEAGRP